MKYRLPFPPPRRADGTLAPAIAAGALAAMLVVQLVVPRQVTLPEPGVVRPFELDPARPTALAPDAVTLVRPLFSPSGPGAAAAAVVEGPVAGATAIGVVARGGRRIGFLQGADGTVVSLAPGGVYRGWRLVAVASTALVFRRGGETATLPVTSSTRAPAPPAVTPQAAMQ